MIDYNSVWMFVKVVQAGSFSGAARQAGIPKSTLSKRISLLERELHVNLLTRTTRQLKLTPAGRTFYETSARAFTELGNAEQQTHSAQQALRGLLRVTAPPEMATSFMTPLISEFMGEYPEVDVQLVLTDALVDLIAENIDVAIRVGELVDSSLISRRIGMACFRLYASPGYIKSHGMPAVPGELERHSCLRFTTAFESEYWELHSGGKKFRSKVKGRFTANHIGVLLAMAVQGHGITLLPEFLCHTEIAQKRLVPVLPRWATVGEPVHLLYPQQKFIAPRQEAFLKFMAARLTHAFGGSR